VDDLDLRIFRWMYPGGVWSWWGVDPRMTTTQIASHVGLERAAVWARIRNWKREGFWYGLGLHPNPELFGLGQAHVEIPVVGPAQGADLIDELEHLDGILWAQVCFGLSVDGREGENVLVAMAAEDATHEKRRVRALRRLSSTGSMGGPFRDVPPPCSHQLTSLDWRILGALCVNPGAAPKRLTRLLGITLKTFARHHANLIERHAVFYIPKVDWSRLECVNLVLLCHSRGDVDRVRAELEVHYPGSVPMTLEGFEGISPDWDDTTCFAAMVPTHSPFAVHALVRDVSRIPGVRRVVIDSWGPERLYPEWAARRIAERIAATQVPQPALDSRRRGPKEGDGRRAALARARPVVAH